MGHKPLIIVITPVRNEAWVLEAFLTCTSSWADKIIIADQHSTDGSREIASKFEKVTLINNNSAEMNQATARKLLFEEVDKIDEDKIVFALDADEFLSKDFQYTQGWKKIVESTPNKLFCFRWTNLYRDYRHTLQASGFMEWACHLDSSMCLAGAYCRCEQRAIHEMRVPCLPIEEASYIDIDDIQFVHLANLNLTRQQNKFNFYQVHTVADLKIRTSAVSLFRTYNTPQPAIHKLKEDIELQSVGDNIDIKSLIKIGDIGQYYVDEMIAIFKRDGLSKYLKLDIWGNPNIKQAGVNPTLPLHYRLLHWYLRKTQKVSGNRPVKYIDKLLKLFI